MLVHSILWLVMVPFFGAQAAKPPTAEEYGRCFQYAKATECQARCCVFVMPDPDVQTDFPPSAGCYPVGSFSSGRPLAGTKFSRKTKFRKVDAEEGELRIPIASRGCSKSQQEQPES